MKRRMWKTARHGALLFLIGLMGSGNRPAAIADEDRPHRPNILLAIADDWAWPHAGVAGDKVVRTPAFDRLAREGCFSLRRSSRHRRAAHRARRS